MVVTSAGAGSVTGEVNFVAGSANTADAFTVSGDASRAFTISTAGGSVTSGTNSMAFTTTSATSGTLNSSGAAGFSVGGELTVGSAQAAGSYTGTYDATVTYN